MKEAALPPERLHLTGCPRFDFTAPRWRSILAQPQQEYLLVNANFPAVNPLFSGSASRERATMIGSGWDAEYADRLFAEMDQLFVDYLANTRKLVEARPDVEFLVRPHPFENPKPYLEACAGLRNVSVSPAGNVLNAIHNCRAILHLNCGTAIEAVMLDKLPIQMEFLNTPTWGAHAKLPAEVSHGAHSFASLLDDLGRIDELTAGFPFSALHAERIQPFFHLNDGMAARRVAEILVRDGTSRDGRRWRSTSKAITGSHPRPSLGQLVNGAISVLLGSSATASLRTWGNPKRSEKRFTPEYVDAMLARLATLDGTSAPHHGSPTRAGPLRRRLESVRVASA